MCPPPSSDRIRRRACGLPYPAFGRRSRPSVCVLTGAPRRRRPGHCPPFHGPIPPPATSTDCPAVSDGGGEVMIPWPVVRGPMAAALPRSRSHVPSPGRFGCATASYVDRPQAQMEFRHRPGTAPGPAGNRPFAPPPAIQLRSRR